MALTEMYKSPAMRNLMEGVLDLQVNLTGHEFYYLQRDIVEIDDVFTEVDYSEVKDSFYFKAVLELGESLNTETESMTMFGLQGEYKLVFSVPDKAFKQYVEKAKEDGQEVNDLLRPMEGDLIYFPYNKNLWQISFVDNRPGPGYKYNDTLVWKCSCNSYEQNSDTHFDTGIDLFDKFDMSQDLLDDQTGSIENTFSITFEVEPSENIFNVGELVTQVNSNGKRVFTGVVDLSITGESNNTLKLKDLTGDFNNTLEIVGTESGTVTKVLVTKEKVTVDNNIDDGSNTSFDKLDDVTWINGVLAKSTQISELEKKVNSLEQELSNSISLDAVKQIVTDKMEETPTLTLDDVESMVSEATKDTTTSQTLSNTEMELIIEKAVQSSLTSNQMQVDSGLTAVQVLEVVKDAIGELGITNDTQTTVNTTTTDTTIDEFDPNDPFSGS